MESFEQGPAYDVDTPEGWEQWMFALLVAGQLPYVTGPMPVAADWFSDDAEDNALRAESLLQQASRARMRAVAGSAGTTPDSDSARASLEAANHLERFLWWVAS